MKAACGIVLFLLLVAMFQSAMYYLSMISDRIEPITGEQAFHIVFAGWVIVQLEIIKQSRGISKQ